VEHPTAEPGTAPSAAPGPAVPTDRAEVPRLTPPLLGALERALAEVLQLDRPADNVLRVFFKANERLGRRDRGVIAETTFDVLRNRRRYGHQAQGLQGPLARRLAWLSLALRFGEAVLPGLKRTRSTRPRFAARSPPIPAGCRSRCG
jgi:hypothetical protein